MANEENLKEWETRKWAEKVNAEARGGVFGTGLGATTPEVGGASGMSELPAPRVVKDAREVTLKK